MHGWTTSDQVRAGILGARALLLPSYAEGLPIVIMEALAMGKPVLTTRITGIPELVDSDCGWIFEPGDIDAMAQALREVMRAGEAERAAMGREGRRRVEERHDIKKSAAELIELSARAANNTKRHVCGNSPIPHRPERGRRNGRPFPLSDDRLAQAASPALRLASAKTRTGSLVPATTSLSTTTSVTPSMVGRSNMVSSRIALDDRAKTTRAGFALDRLLGDRGQRFVGKGQINILHLEELRYCFTSALRGSVRIWTSASILEVLERRDDRQTADELGDQRRTSADLPARST